MFLEGDSLLVLSLLHPISCLRYLSVWHGGQCGQEERDVGNQAEHCDWLGHARLHRPLQHVF